MKVKRIKPAAGPYPFEAYGHIIAPLSAEDGGGYMITLPDIPGSWLQFSPDSPP